MSVQDNFDTPGYREWDAVELRLILHRCGLSPEGDGVWVDEEWEIAVVVTPVGLFAGWDNSIAQLPMPSIRRLGDTIHLPVGSESDLDETLVVLRRKRLAALIQCRHCGEMITPGWISDRCCIDCLSDVHGIIP